jgi:hypothetical protein
MVNENNVKLTKDAEELAVVVEDLTNVEVVALPSMNSAPLLKELSVVKSLDCEASPSQRQKWKP